MNEFIRQAKQYSFRTAVNNWLIGFTKHFIGAKRIQITYKARLNKLAKEIYEEKENN